MAASHEQGMSRSLAAGGGRGWRLQRRSDPPHVQRYRLGAVLAGLVLVVVLGSFAVEGTPTEYFEALWLGTFGAPAGLETLLSTTMPYLLLGLAVALPLRLGLWNVGGDGQLLMGAWAATGVAFLFPSWPGFVLVPVMFLSAALCGALWVLGPALARARFGVNEIITTLLLNFVAMFWLTYWAVRVWGETQSAGSITSKLVPESTFLGFVEIGDTAVPIGLIGALVLAIAIWVWMQRSRFGYELEMVGANDANASYAGIPAKRRLVQVMLIGGAIAGLAGCAVLLNTTHRYGSGLSDNYGFIAFVIAVLAAGRPSGVIVLSLLLATMSTAMNALVVFGVSSDLLFAVFGLVLILGALGDGMARFRLIRLELMPDNTPALSPATAAGPADRHGEAA